MHHSQLSSYSFLTSKFMKMNLMNFYHQNYTDFHLNYHFYTFFYLNQNLNDNHLLLELFSSLNFKQDFFQFIKNEILKRLHLFPSCFHHQCVNFDQIFMNGFLLVSYPQNYFSIIRKHLLSISSLIILFNFKFSYLKCFFQLVNENLTSIHFATEQFNLNSLHKLFF